MLIPLLAFLPTPSTEAQLRIESGSHLGAVTAAVPLKSGGFATLGVDKTIRFWKKDGRPGSVVRYPSGGGDDGIGRGLTSGGDRIATLASSGSGYVTYVTDLAALAENPREKLARIGSTAPVQPALLDDGKSIAMLDGDLNLCVGPLGSSLKRGPQVASEANDALISVSPDSKRIVVAVLADGKSILNTYDAKTLASTEKPLHVPSELWAVAADNDATWVAGGRLAGLEKDGALKSLDLAGDWRSVAPMPDGGAVFVGMKTEGERPVGGVAVAVDREGKPRWETKIGLAYGQAVAVAKDGTVLVGTVTGDLFRIGPKGGEPTLLGGGRERTVDVAWSKDGSCVEWSSDLDLEKRKQPVYDHAFSLSEQSLVPVAPTADDGGKLDHRPGKVVTASGESLSLSREEGMYEGEIFAAVALPNGRFVVSTQEGIAAYSSKGKRVLDLDCQRCLVSGLALSPDSRYLAATGSDGIVRIFAVADLAATDGDPVKPMASLFARKKGDWILWSGAQNLYASSVDGDRLLNIQRTQEDGSVLFEPVVTREGTYRCPAVLRKAFEVGSIEKATEGTEYATKPALTSTASASIQLVRSIPGVTLDKEGKLVTTMSEVKLTFRVSQGVQRVLLTENVPTKEVLIGAAGNEGSDRRSILASLTPGDNRLKIVGVLKDGTTSAPEEIFIRLEGAPLPSTMRVLVIGVTGYNVPGLSDLPNNEHDAAAIAAHFNALKGKLEAQDVVTTVLPTGQTTHAGIRKALEDFKGSIQPGDVAVLYVSSHGMKGKDGFVMLPNDFSPDDDQKRGILWQTVVDAISTKPCKAAVLIQDACHAGGVVKDSDATELKDAREAADRLSQKKNLYVFSSCQSSEASHVDSPHELSVFTRALLEGMRGDLPDAVNLDGKILLTRLETPVVARVERIIRELVDGKVLSKVAKGGSLADPSQVPQLYSPWSDITPIVVGVKEGAK